MSARIAKCYIKSTNLVSTIISSASGKSKLSKAILAAKSMVNKV